MLRHSVGGWASMPESPRLSSRRVGLYVETPSVVSTTRPAVVHYCSVGIATEGGEGSRCHGRERKTRTIHECTRALDDGAEQRWWLGCRQPSLHCLMRHDCLQVHLTVLKTTAPILLAFILLPQTQAFTLMRQIACLSVPGSERAACPLCAVVAVSPFPINGSVLTRQSSRPSKLSPLLRTVAYVSLFRVIA